jgi:hypothetical protein
MSMKNSSDTIGNRSRDLPVCSAVPQPLRHRVPLSNTQTHQNYLGNFNFSQSSLAYCWSIVIVERDCGSCHERDWNYSYASCLSVALKLWKTWLFLFLATSLHVVMWYSHFIGVKAATKCLLPKNIIVTVWSARKVTSMERGNVARFSICGAEALCFKWCDFTGLSRLLPVSCSTSSTRINGCDQPALLNYKLTVWIVLLKRLSQDGVSCC